MKGIDIDTINAVKMLAYNTAHHPTTTSVLPEVLGTQRVLGNYGLRVAERSRLAHPNRSDNEVYALVENAMRDLVGYAGRNNLDGQAQSRFYARVDRMFVSDADTPASAAIVARDSIDDRLLHLTPQELQLIDDPDSDPADNIGSVERVA